MEIKGTEVERVNQHYVVNELLADSRGLIKIETCRTSSLVAAKIKAKRTNKLRGLVQ